MQISTLQGGAIRNFKVLITGGAGFIGSNLTERFLSKGSSVTVLDNLSRPEGGAKKNIEYLLKKHKSSLNFEFIKEDVRNFNQLKEAVKGKDVVIHAAAQVAMTTSIEAPVEDFEVNARGTFNVLEAIRRENPNSMALFTSTNKVYGDLTKKPVKLVEKEKRWDFNDEEYFKGINEDYPLDYEGPYGCSKGIGDAYFLDYARTFGLKTVVFRMSTIYGVGQHPTEDQAWIAWFIRCALEGKPVVIYGDGKQVRDVLFIEDLINAFEKVIENINKAKGNAYNIGGGRGNSLSILELLEIMEKELRIKPSEIRFDSWRRGDQKVYISNVEKAKRDFGWEPRVKKEEGIRRLYEWMREGR